MDQNSWLGNIIQALMQRGDGNRLTSETTPSNLSPQLQFPAQMNAPGSLDPSRLKEWEVEQMLRRKGMEHLPIAVPEPDRGPSTFNERFGAVNPSPPATMPTFTPPARVPLPMPRPQERTPIHSQRVSRRKQPSGQS